MPVLNDADALYAGSLTVDKAYLGSVQAWPISGFSPLSLSPALWVDASQITGKSDGDAVSQWSDLSGNNRHLLQATGAAQPLYKTNILNGKPVVRFDGSDDVLKYAPGSVWLNGAGQTVFCVYRNGASIIANTRIWAMGDSAGNPDYATDDSWLLYNDTTTTASLYRFGDGVTRTVAANTAYVASARNDGSLDYHDQNGSETSTGVGKTAAFATRYLTLGAGWNGTAAADFKLVDIAEFAVFNSHLADSDRADMRLYLEAKWGITGT